MQNDTITKIKEMQQIRRERVNNIITQQNINKPLQIQQQPINNINPPTMQNNQSKLNNSYFSTDLQKNKINSILGSNKSNISQGINMSQNIVANQNNTTQDMLSRLRSINNQSQTSFGDNYNNENINKSAILQEGQKYIGTKYVWGGNNLSKGVDCSGLTQQLFKQQGIKLPRTAAEQSKGGKTVNYSDLQPGDLVFFNTIEGNNKEVDHVGIYQGNGQMLHASSSKGVKIEDFTKKYWQSKLVKAKRY